MINLYKFLGSTNKIAKDLGDGLVTMGNSRRKIK